MVQRLAVSLALIVFVVCLVIGGLEADNPFDVAVKRALAGLFGTYVVGLAVGLAGQKMLEENVKGLEEKCKNSAANLEVDGR